MDIVIDLLANAEVAFSNKQYDVALNWYHKVLEITPDDVYVLSRAGALCVPLGKFEEAKLYFSRAKELDPENGDNVFNYGNACFFNKDNAKAFEQYVEAERLGCSDDVKPRLYYQMALLCSMRQDIKSSLIYFQKCEESDKTGMIALNPDLISEKMKLYMLQKDYANAGKCAAQLVAINPTDFKGYMVYFGMLMANKNYAKAEKLLDDAGKYAEMSDDHRFALVMQFAALYAAKGDSEKTVQILEDRKKLGGLTNEQLTQLLLAQAEAYSKSENYDTAIAILEDMLTGRTYAASAKDAGVAAQPIGELTIDEADAMLQQDIENIQEKIASGEMDPDMGLYASADYDEEGILVHNYDSAAFGLTEMVPTEESEEEKQPAEGYDMPKDLQEKAVFTLLSCYLAKDEFAQAQKFANVLKNSQNKYYNYFGVYVSAMTEKKLTGKSETAERKYAEAIAFFRNKIFSDATDVLACIFRARLYAEQGKFEKADEIASLLSESDRKSVQDYIESCKL